MKNRMKTRASRTLYGLLGLTLLVGLTAAAPSLHFKLDKSEPGQNAETLSPEAVKLWFSQVPQAKSTSIRLLDAGGDPVETGDVIQDSEDGRLQSVALLAKLAPGAYSVAWRSMASDGHVVRGDFAFTVLAETQR